MSLRLIDRSPDLLRLRNEGYEVEVRGGHLLVHSVPYVNSRREVCLGTIVTDLCLSGDQTGRPGDHQVWFSGEFPCKSDGSPISAIAHSSGRQDLGNGIVVDHRFSNKPEGGYADYHAKVSRYIEIISHQARAIDCNVTARTFKPIKSQDDESIFHYVDSASARAGIAAVSERLGLDQVAIIGLGGTGSYVLDQLAKTPVREIHLFDGDQFLQHNAFRSPGAASFEELEERLTKVAYWSRLYSKMRKGVVPHEVFVDEDNVGSLHGFDFCFICVDSPQVRAIIADGLVKLGVAFIDVGMDVELLEDQRALIGACRVTLVTPQKRGHFAKHVSSRDVVRDEVYDSNIQVADLNALNATLAVIKWKKYFGFYQDLYKEHQSAYAINTHQLSREELGEKSS